MISERLNQLLDREKVRYTTITHLPAHSAQETAAKAHVPGRELAKTVIAKLDDEMVMVVLPGSMKLDLARLLEATGAQEVELAHEAEFTRLFPDCQVGAMPPFGGLYGLRTLVAEELVEDEEIAFNAGSDTELVRMAYRDYARLVRPTLLPLRIAVS